MDPLDALAQELGLTPQQTGLQNHVLWPAPEDPPFREAFILDREHYMHRLEGFAIAVSILILLMARGWWLKGAILAGVLYMANVYMVSMKKVEKWNLREKLRTEGRLIEGPLQNPRYTVQPVSTLAELY
jgi:hypothetical protein